MERSVRPTRDQGSRKDPLAAKTCASAESGLRCDIGCEFSARFGLHITGWGFNWRFGIGNIGRMVRLLTCEKYAQPTLSPSGGNAYITPLCLYRSTISLYRHNANDLARLQS